MITSIIAAIASLGAIAGLISKIWDAAAKALTKTSAEKAQDIAVAVQKQEQGFKDTGRPTS